MRAFYVGYSSFQIQKRTHGWLQTYFGQRLHGNQFCPTTIGNGNPQNNLR